ncbi:hypothetical protein ACFT6Z_21100 [Streptomyces sp. NPDC057131]|uniref:hypothetical protein n=1 Tax=Streptomyces sp. NPDC057131 TaxID=3346027 RepID=UPI00363D1F1E
MAPADLRIDGDALAKPVVVLPQGLGGGFGVVGAGVQMLERGRDAARLGFPATPIQGISTASDHPNRADALGGLAGPALARHFGAASHATTPARSRMSTTTTMSR